MVDEKKSKRKAIRMGRQQDAELRQQKALTPETQATTEGIDSSTEKKYSEIDKQYLAKQNAWNYRQKAKVTLPSNAWHTEVIKTTLCKSLVRGGSRSSILSRLSPKRR